MPQDVSVTIGACLFNYRVAAIIYHQSNILVNKLHDQDFWFLPGGRVQEGESSQEALERELYEELGTRCFVKRPVFFHENFFQLNDKQFHEVSVYYEVELPKDVAVTLGEVSAADGGLHLKWIGMRELESINLQPPFLTARLQQLPAALEHIVSREKRSHMPRTQTRTQDILTRDAAHNAGLWQPDIAFTHGDGALIYDADGREYIDCLAGIAVASVGHGNPRLADALYRQAQRLIICSQAHANDTRTEFYDRLFSFIPAWMGLTRVFMANSGSEVNEAALKWARAATGRPRFVSAKRGFSGRTMGALSITWEKKYREPFEPLAYQNDFIRYNSVEELDRYVTEETAAVFLEPVQGEGGMHVADRDFLEAARRITRERGALLILDEVQSGVGRTGTFLALEPYGIQPDMVTLAKGLGGGVPIGALLMSEEVAHRMPKGGHGTTFGGNALASAAAVAVLDEIRERRLMENAAEVGAHFQEQLRALGSPKIREVRGRGLMIGVELKEKAAPYIAALRDAGVLVINAGATVVRFVPPLIITREQVDEVVRRFGAVLEATTSEADEA